MRRLSAAACVSWVLVACAGPEPARSLVVATHTPVLTLDPHRHNDNPTFSALSHFYEGLVGYDPGLQVVPLLAESWANVSPLVVRFRLRPGVRFHDGRPVQADDVRASLRRAMTITDPGLEPFLRSVREVRAVDAATVEVETRSPSPLLLNELVYVSVMPRDAPPGPVPAPIGTGPYRFVAGGPGQPVQGAAWPGYWGAPPAFPEFRVEAIAEGAARVQALAQGRADVVDPWPDEPIPDDPTARLVVGDGPGVTLLGFGMSPGSPFADRRVREAVALALDRQRLVQEAMAGRAEPEAQIVPRGIFGHDPALAGPSRDPQKARRLLAEAGHPGGLESELWASTTAEAIARALAAQLAAIGLRLSVRVLPWPEFREQVLGPGRERPLLLRSVSSGTGDAADLLEGLFHTPGRQLGQGNLSGYSSPELDRLIERAAVDVDVSERRDLLHGAMRILARDLPVLPLLARKRVYGVRDGIEWRPRLDGRVLAQEMRPSR